MGDVSSWLDGWELRPWQTNGMTTSRWMKLPLSAVDPRSVTPTQPSIYWDGDEVMAGGTFSGDVYPHVVRFQDHLWLDDGHHRVAQAIFLRLPLIAARVLDL